MKHTASNQRKQPTLGIVTGMAVVGFLSGQMAIAHNNDYTNRQAWKSVIGDPVASRYIPQGNGGGVEIDEAQKKELIQKHCELARQGKARGTSDFLAELAVRESGKICTAHGGKI